MSAQSQIQAVVSEKCGGRLELESTQSLTECRWCGVILRIDWGEGGVTSIANLGLRLSQVEQEASALAKKRDQEEQNRKFFIKFMLIFLVLVIGFCSFMIEYESARKRNRTETGDEVMPSNYDSMSKYALQKSRQIKEEAKRREEAEREKPIRPFPVIE